MKAITAINKVTVTLPSGPLADFGENEVGEERHLSGTVWSPYAFTHCRHIEKKYEKYACICMADKTISMIDGGC